MSPTSELVLYGFAFVAGYCVPMWFLMTCAFRLKEMNALLRALIDATHSEDEAPPRRKKAS